MIRYRFDILEALKEAGYSTYRLRKEKIMGEALIQKIRHGEAITFILVVSGSWLPAGRFDGVRTRPDRR